jgi:Uma2 family endonuclease
MAICSLDLAGGPYTYADLERLPEDERIHYELSYGTLVVTPAPTVRHQELLGDLVVMLKRLVPSGFVVLPEADLLLTESLVKRPDIQVRSQLATGRYVAGVPELMVEILSPVTRMIDSPRSVRCTRKPE